MPKRPTVPAAQRYEARRAYRERNKKVLAAKQAEWRRANADHVRSYNQTYRAEHSEWRKAMIAKDHAKRRQLREMRGATTIAEIDIYVAARRALPSGLPPHIRDDVIADIVVAYLENKLPLDQIGKRAGEFLRAHNRMFDQWKTVSLDAPVPGTDLRRIDTIAAADDLEEELLA